ncbi:hypothetical protein APHAL10511_007399 [Amanita phalloides]|nr:hypothetical protein APHAL10511_007399 [Amanita phalloides]
MSLLYNNLRIHQVFGANTDVGKTILTSALIRASVARNAPVFYLKPVSTGRLENADDRHVIRHGGAPNLITTHCLFRYDEPVSPHLAARLKNAANIPTDETMLRSISDYVQRSASKISKGAHMYIETAGGVHSPTLSGTTQADFYRPLFFPTILIGDSKLGGISSTISSYESLLLRGYIIDAVVIFRDEYYRNWEYLSPYFSDRGVHISAFEPPPPLHPESSENVKLTDNYYSILVPGGGTNGMFTVMEHLDGCHENRLRELESMPRRTLDAVWWPFVQHGLVKDEKDVTVIDSAYSDFFSTFQNGKDSAPQNSSTLTPVFDSSASWWTQALGHGHPALSLAAAKASGRYGHVMFPKATHLPALNLAERLVRQGPGKGWASRVFYSDNGATGMEVALKMALRAYTVRHGKSISRSEQKSLGILGLKGSYHGDTIGAMDACEEVGVYTCEWHNAKGYWFDPPSIGIRQNVVTISLPSAIADLAGSAQISANSLAWAYDMGARLRTPLAQIYAAFIQQTLNSLEQQGGLKLAALVLEPLLMGAGGMIFIDPLFQRVLIDVVRGKKQTSGSDWSGMPVIFDEVFIGLYRTGMQSAGPLLGVNPDISVNAKILTGGLVPLAATLASEHIFNAFLGDEKATALLHGHSYTAHPVGCEVANTTLKLIEQLEASPSWQAARSKWIESEGKSGPVWSFWDPDFVNAISSTSATEEVMTLGCVLAIKLKDTRAGYNSHSAEELMAPLRATSDDRISSPAPGGLPYNIHFRTLGNVAYFMTSLNTSPSVLRSVEDKIWKVLNKHEKNGAKYTRTHN